MNTLSERLDQQLVDLAWSLWTELGVAGVHRSHQQFMVFPEELPDGLYGHFFRGFFDGDGSVGVYGRWDNLRVSLFGQKDFIERVHEDTNRITGACGGGVRRGTSGRDDFFTCSWGAKEDVGRIIKWMYDGCGELLLTRKKAVFDKWMAVHGGDGDLRVDGKWRKTA